jgi:hypothetical protein
MSTQSGPHRIRLIGPWELKNADGCERVHLPRDWAVVAGDKTSELKLSRRFHRPTRLDESTVVSIVMPAAWDIPALSLNGQRIERALHAGEFQKFEVTAVLKSQEAHELELIVRNGRAAPFLVAIEIESRTTTNQ